MKIATALIACGTLLASSPAPAQKLKQAIAGPFYNCTADQKAAIETAAGQAQTRVWRTKMAYAGIGPASNDREVEQIALKQRRALALEDSIFGRNDTDIAFYVSAMHANLMEKNRDIRCAPNTDKECGPLREAYVKSAERKVIWVCPVFFKRDLKAKAEVDASPKAAEQRVRTIIHEAAHSAGIGESSAGESYCADITCDSTCGSGGAPGKGTLVADNWSAFVHCASGQPPDVHDVVRGTQAGVGRLPARP